MITPYFADESQQYYNNYYANQVGSGLGVFSGSTIHKGAGIGSLIGSIFKKTMPLITKGAKTIGKQLVQTGINIAKDTIQGGDIKSSTEKNFKDAGSNLLSALADSFSNPITHTQQKKRTKKRPAKSTKAPKKRKTSTLFQDIKLAA
jgi:hypothetical protein